MKFPSVKKLEKAIGIPAQDWVGRCHEIAVKTLRTGLVKGEDRYGHYHGFIHPLSHFHGRPFTHHGWILLPDRRVCDPTRWVFEAAMPYLYVSRTTDNQEYDHGGNLLRKKMRIDPKVPEFDNSSHQIFNFSNADVSVRDFLLRTFGMITLSLNQMFYLGNLPLDEFEGLERPVYEAIIALGMQALIPLDNRLLVMRDENVPKHSTQRKSTEGRDVLRICKVRRQ